MKVAIVGAGKMGRNVLSHLKREVGLDALLAVDPDPAALDRAASEHGALPVAWDVVLADTGVRLVFITTPNHTHFPLAKQALEAGKAVMLEKPMGNTLEEARSLVELAESRGAYLQIGFELRYSRAYAQICSWIDAGLLGEVINTQCTYYCSEFHGKGSWRNRNDTAGGMFGEKLSHYVDLPRWYVGRPVLDVYSVCAPNIVTYKEVHDNYHTIYRFEGGAVSELTFMMATAATFRGDPLQSIEEQQKEDGHALRMFVVGRSGAAEVDVFRRTIKRWQFGDSPERMTSDLVETLTWPAEESHFYIHNTTDQALDICRRVREGLPPFNTARDSYETMRLVFAAEESASGGGLVSLEEDDRGL